MALNEHPGLQKEFQNLQAEKGAVISEMVPLRKRLDEIADAMGPLQSERREIGKRLAADFNPRLINLDKRMAAIAQGTGGKLLNGPG